jgi:hypothetical protein
VGVDEHLLVDAADAPEGADIERIGEAEIAGMLGFDLAVRLFLAPGISRAMIWLPVRTKLGLLRSRSNDFMGDYSD